jgi:hypothetical protein
VGRRGDRRDPRNNYLLRCVRQGLSRSPQRPAPNLRNSRTTGVPARPRMRSTASSSGCRLSGEMVSSSGLRSWQPAVA